MNLQNRYDVTRYTYVQSELKLFYDYRDSITLYFYFRVCTTANSEIVRVGKLITVRVFSWPSTNTHFSVSTCFQTLYPRTRSKRVPSWRGGKGGPDVINELFTRVIYYDYITYYIVIIIHCIFRRTSVLVFSRRGAVIGFSRFEYHRSQHRSE